MAKASMDTFNKEPKDIWIAINYDGKLTGSKKNKKQEGEKINIVLKNKI